MPNFIFPKLADSNQFEYMLRDLYNAMFPTATIDKYGRQGQKQHGVDITVQFQQCNCGAENEGQDHLWCIQCKNYDTLTVSDVDNILAACTFYKEVALFDKFIIATFAPRDVAVVKCCFYCRDLIIFQHELPGKISGAKIFRDISDSKPFPCKECPYHPDVKNAPHKKGDCIPVATCARNSEYMIKPGCDDTVCTIINRIPEQQDVLAWEGV